MRAGSKLSPADVTAIRERLAAGETCAELGQEFSVHPGHISRIKHRRVWTELEPDAGTPDPVTISRDVAEKDRNRTD